MSAIPTTLASMVAVRDLVEGITAQEYSDEKVTESLLFGNSEVCLATNKFEWDTTDKQYFRAKEAANYFAASNLIPKTVRDRDTGVPLFVTYRKLGLELTNAINEGLPSDSGTEETGYLIIKSTSVRNYYKNKNISPFMVAEAWGGTNNDYNPEEYSFEQLG